MAGDAGKLGYNRKIFILKTEKYKETKKPKFVQNTLKLFEALNKWHSSSPKHKIFFKKIALEMN